MEVYIGNTGNPIILQVMRDRGLRLMISATGWRTPNKGVPWALDNGAYTFWNRGEEWDARPLLKAIEKINGHPAPDFIVLPDRIAAGRRSYIFSCNFLDQNIWPEGVPLYFVVQNDMTEDDFDGWVLEKIGGIFVGGTLKWKLQTGERWVEFAHGLGLPCHIGRVGVYRRLLWASRIGADSVDSSTLVQNPDWERRLAEVADVQAGNQEVLTWAIRGSSPTH